MLKENKIQNCDTTCKNITGSYYNAANIVANSCEASTFDYVV